ncbi:hypothetical protein [Streptomyces sp. NPDC019937]|uniref:hypothetical protein n=1 Tax=Streptomyces sp. NPDC019937 TaxID=3154787 RepID=UPI0033ECD20D
MVGGCTPAAVLTARVETASTDPGAKTSHEIDVAVFGRDTGERETLLAIGEAKWNDIMGLGHLRRLEHLRGLLGARSGAREQETRLLCFSGAGFTEELRDLASRDETIQLIDLGRLYHGM